MIVAIGAYENDNIGIDSGHMRVFFYTSSTNKWDILGSPIVGAAAGDYFGNSVSLSSDRIIVVIRAL